MIDTNKVRELLSRDEYAGGPELVIRELCDEIDRLRARLAVLEGAAKTWARERRYSPGSARTKALADELAALLPGEDKP